MDRDTRVPSMLTVAAIVALTAGCAGSGGARPAATSETLVAADGEWIRCVDEPLTGSRIPQRKCLTESQWRRLEEASRDNARALQGPIYGPKDAAAPGTPPL